MHMYLHFQGKIFPRLIRRSSNRRILSSSDVGDEATDYVFRVMTSPSNDGKFWFD